MLVKVIDSAGFVAPKASKDKVVPIVVKEKRKPFIN
jgi:hypothetical protein